MGVPLTKLNDSRLKRLKVASSSGQLALRGADPNKR
jgi:hypothetical protein